MSRPLPLSLFIATLLLGFWISHPVQAAFNPEAYYEKRCSSCHTVGGGDDVGPDLKGVTERRQMDWLFPMIRSSQTLIQSGDPIANELFNKFKRKKMPDQDISDEEIKQLLEFLKKGGPVEKPLDTKSATLSTPQEVELGRNLFLGRVAFAQGAPACISCHSVGNEGPLGGGTLGPDLTQVYSRYEDQGLSKALTKMGFNVMQEVYLPKPLSSEEIYALKAFLYQEDKKGESVGGYQKKFVFLAIGGCVLMLGVIDLSWRRRRKQSAKPVHGGPA